MSGDLLFGGSEVNAIWTCWIKLYALSYLFIKLLVSMFYSFVRAPLQVLTTFSPECSHVDP